MRPHHAHICDEGIHSNLSQVLLPRLTNDAPPHSPPAQREVWPWSLDPGIQSPSPWSVLPHNNVFVYLVILGCRTGWALGPCGTSLSSGRAGRPRSAPVSTRPRSQQELLTPQLRRACWLATQHVLLLGAAGIAQHPRERAAGSPTSRILLD